MRKRKRPMWINEHFECKTCGCAACIQKAGNINCKLFINVKVLLLQEGPFYVALVTAFSIFEPTCFYFFPTEIHSSIAKITFYSQHRFCLFVSVCLLLSISKIHDLHLINIQQKKEGRTMSKWSQLKWILSTLCLSTGVPGVPGVFWNCI